MHWSREIQAVRKPGAFYKYIMVLIDNFMCTAELATTSRRRHAALNRADHYVGELMKRGMLDRVDPYEHIENWFQTSEQASASTSEAVRELH